MTSQSQPPGPKIKAKKFKHFSDILSALKSSEQALLAEALTNLRSQLTLQAFEAHVAPTDDRLLLAAQWLEASPGATEIFDLWERADSRQHSFVASLLHLISCLLRLLSAHYTHHAQGQSILKTLLTTAYMRRINSYVTGAHNELILASLKLLNVMSDYAGGRERKAVMEGFAWEAKTVSKLLFMRRRTKEGGIHDTLLRPDIRTLFVLLLLTFVSNESPSQLKSAYLEHHRDIFSSMFKGIAQDHYNLAKRILEVCWLSIWQDPKIKRTFKLAIFNESTITHLLKLYERNSPEDSEQGSIPADLVHHFLLAITTHPGSGICFKDQGWYPREYLGDDIIPRDEDPKPDRGGKIYNKILANVLKLLKLNEDSRQQELAFKILQACPELVAGYWANAGLVLEPRLSSKWLINAAFMGTIVSQPPPLQTFFLRNSKLFQPLPPPINIVLENILPSPITKVHLSKGLQSPSGLVQHTAATLLSKCLIKLHSVLNIFRQAGSALEENETDGQWARRLRDIEREARCRVPEFQVIVAFSQAKNDGTDQLKAALLNESSQRLLWLYHKCLPSLIEEARFDFGKSLTQVVGFHSENEDGETLETTKKLRIVEHLHLLRLLKDSNQFVWNVKPSGATHTYLYTLLKLATTSEVPAIRFAVDELLRHILSPSILFQDDTEETQIWLYSLPLNRRPPTAKSPDGAPLADEGESVIMFLDDCVQRCLKTPHKYIEELYSMRNTGQSEGTKTDVSLQGHPSPLLMTMLEQLSAKINRKSLSASDVLALGTCLRKVLYGILTKENDPSFLQVYADRIDSVLAPENLYPEFPTMTAAIRREIGMLQFSLKPMGTSMVDSVMGEADDVEDFIEMLEQISGPKTLKLREIAAYELVDWFRVVDQPLTSKQITRVLRVIQFLDPIALEDAIDVLDPRVHGCVWDGLSQLEGWEQDISFETLLLHSQASDLEDPEKRNTFVELLFNSSPDAARLKRVINLASHHIRSCDNERVIHGMLLLVTQIVTAAQEGSNEDELLAVKEYIFSRPGPIKNLFLAHAPSKFLSSALQELKTNALDASNPEDRLIVSDIAQHWMAQVLAPVRIWDITESLLSCTWSKYLDAQNVFKVFDCVTEQVNEVLDGQTSALVESLLQGFELLISLDPTAQSGLSERLPKLLVLADALPQSEPLGRVTALALEVSIPFGCKLNERSQTSVCLSDFTKRAETRWSRRRVDALNVGHWQQLFEQKNWPEPTLDIITSALYRGYIPTEVFLHWLSSDGCALRPMEQFSPILLAFLDVISCRGNAQSPIKASQPHSTRLIDTLFDPQVSTTTAKTCASCLLILAQQDATIVNAIASLLVTKIEKLDPHVLPFSLIELVNHIIFSKSQTLLEVLAEHGISWAIRQMSDETEFEKVQPTFSQLDTLLTQNLDISNSVVETYVGLAISQMKSLTALRIVNKVIRLTHMKPLFVNRHIQSIIQHPQFLKMCHPSGQSGLRLRDAIVDILSTLFHLHPSNTCQVSHVQPLVRIYKGTLSTSDVKLLSIFRLFEQEKKLSVVSLLFTWSWIQGEKSKTLLEALQSLDPILVLRTCLNFPCSRQLNEGLNDDPSQHESQLYDPVFLVLLFSQMLVECPADSPIAWVELFRTNIVGLLIRTLSADDPQLRAVALCQLAALWKNLEPSDMLEQPQIHYILTLLKNALPEPSPSTIPRLPSYTTLILSHALRGIFYPSNFTYPLTARFLLQRPEIDVTDVPMLYGMLYSSSDDWKKERGWIIRFLSDGMMNSDDWRVLKRRHTWDLLASMFQSSQNDKSLRHGIFEVLANLTCNKQATNSLILKSSLLSWIEMQVTNSQGQEDLEWLKVLENIVVVVDASRVEASTSGEWRVSLCRSASAILKRTREALPLVSTLILRIAKLEGKAIPSLSQLLMEAVDCLRSLESNLVMNIEDAEKGCDAQKSPSYPPHHSYEIRDAILSPLTLGAWGGAVDSLWQVTMALEETRESQICWDALTSRMLARRILGSPENTNTEWIRKEVVSNLFVVHSG